MTSRLYIDSFKDGQQDDILRGSDMARTQRRLREHPCPRNHCVCKEESNRSRRKRTRNMCLPVHNTYSKSNAHKDKTRPSHPQAYRQIRQPNRVDVNALQGDDTARRLILVLRGNEVVQNSVVQDEPMPPPLANVTWDSRGQRVGR